MNPERKAQLAIWMAQRSSRNRTWLDKLCRRLVERSVATAPEEDFLRDEWIDNDEGFDPEELERYQRGEQPLQDR
ncbi:MAG: hypothetical protein AAGF46_09960 [Pseudomonadota bacterium]